MSNNSKTNKHLRDFGVDFADSDFEFPSAVADALATDTRSQERELKRLRDVVPMDKRVPELRRIDPRKRYVTDWEYLTPRQKQDGLVDMLGLWFDAATLGEGIAMKAGPKLVGAAAKRIEAGMPRLADYFLHPKMLKTRVVRGGKIGTEATSVPPPIDKSEWLKGTTPHKAPDIDATMWPFKETKVGGVRKVAPVPPKKYTGDFDWRVYTGWDDAPELIKKGTRLREIGPASVELLGR